MGIVDRLFRKARRVTADDPRFDRIVQKLISGDDTTFGEGSTEVLAVPESDPLRVRAIRQAIRLRSGKRDVLFYEPSVGGLTVRGGDEVVSARDQILRLASKSSLLEDPRVSGNLLSAFVTIHGFQGVVDLAYEIREVAGLDQFQAFQLLYNQNRSAVVLRTSRGEKTWTDQVTEE